MKTVVPAATRRAMYDRAVSAQACLERWLERLSQLSAEQQPPGKGMHGLEFLRGKPKPEFIAIPYKDFNLMMQQLYQHSEAIKKLKKPVVQRPRIV